jgi:hypothetical protein
MHYSEKVLWETKVPKGSSKVVFRENVKTEEFGRREETQ